MRKIVMVSLAICICMAPLQLTAARYDASAPLLCAVIQVFECGVEGDCYPVTAEVANIPHFLNINFKKKIITATEESGREDMTKIKNFERFNGKIVLQGSENGRGWTIVISEETGKLSATVSDEQVGFVVFGVSTQL